jgi:tRNA modification GTPase
MFLFNKDTIAAFATAPSSGAVALLRISGGEAEQILKLLTRRQNFTERRVSLVKIYDGQDILDSAVAVLYKNPKSYTGEDVVELTMHAGPYIKSRILELLALNGVRPAKAGEFTMRAFLNGKMDLAQAQGVADIIASKNKAAHKAAMNSLDGKLSAKFKNIKQNLTELLAQIEVRIDDADEEMPALDQKYAQDILNSAINEAQALSSTFSSGRMVKEGIKTAIIGVPNSGKSSLLNALLGFDRAIVSPVSGTTRDTVEAPLEINGFNIILTDTAGIREHSLDPAEIEGMQRSRRAVENADIVIFVKDINAKDAALQQSLYEEVSSSGKKVITALNKADILPADFKAGEEILISCKTSEGLDALKKEVIKVIGLGALQEDDILITSAVHYEALLKAARELKAACLTLNDGELTAEHIRQALAALKELIGEVTPDDVLDIIFSKFCVGK